MPDLLNLVSPVLETAQRHPAKTAVEDRADRWTYGQLLAKAHGVAAHLEARGAGPGDRVALVAGKDRHAAAAVLGCWLARVSIACLDESWPADLVVGALERTAPAYALIADGFGDFPPACVDAVRTRLPWSDVRHLLELAGEPVVAAGAHGGDTAYLGLTSGSTGRPKVVAMSHAAFADSMTRHIADFGFDATDRVAVQSGFTFDPALMDLLSALWCGGTAVMIPTHAYWAGADWREALVRHRVTSLMCVPGALEIGLESLPLGTAFAPLRRIVLTGDTVRPALLRLAGRRLTPGTALYNALGLTECPYLLGGAVDPDDVRSANRFTWTAGPESVRLIPQGGSDNAVQVYRLHAGGPVLCDGYRAPDAGVERVASADGWFDTGDLFVRDGEAWRHAGRADRRLNWWGYRIEPAEIEGAAMLDPRVAWALAAVDDHDRLVCEVMIAEDAADEAEAVLAAVRETFDRALPATYAGKVGIQVLLAPECFQNHLVAPDNAQTLFESKFR